MTIQKLKEENRELKNQRTLIEPTKAPLLNLSFLGNESETCDSSTYNLLVFNQNAKDGINEEAIITRGLSSVTDQRTNLSVFTRSMNPYSVIGQVNSSYKIGDQDQFISSFNTNGKFRYTLNGACGVRFQGRIHFFGGWSHPEAGFRNDVDY